MTPWQPEPHADLAPLTPAPDAAHPTAPGDARRPDAVGDFTRLAMWMAGTLAGLVTAVLVAQGPFFRDLAKRVGGGGGKPRRPERRGEGSRRDARRPTRAQALPMLAEAIVGNSKAAVASVFGPPRSAVLAGSASPGATYWDADTWYYAMPRAGQLAMAVEFADEYATGVLFLTPPAARG